MKINQNNNYYLTKIIGNLKEKLSNVSFSIADKQKLKISNAQSIILMKSKEIENSVAGMYAEAKNDFEMVTKLISKLNPLEILKNGFSVVEIKKSRISSIDGLNVGDDVQINFEDGIADVKVLKLTKKSR